MCAWRPDVVVSNSLEMTIVGRIVADQYDAPLVGIYHEQAPEAEPFGRGRMSLAYRRAAPDLVLAGCEFYAERARSFLSDEIVRVVYHGVDTGLFSPRTSRLKVRSRYGLRDDEILIVNSGRLKPRKGQLELVRAFASICDERARLLIVGSLSSASIEYADSLEKEINRLDVGHRTIIDRNVGYVDMPEVLAAADLVAQPSLAEGFSLAVLEAMSVGRPVITTRIASSAEMRLSSDNAILVAPGEVDELASALNELVDDRDLRLMLGRAGRKHVVDNFSLDNMIEQTDQAIRSLVARFYI